MIKYSIAIWLMYRIYLFGIVPNTNAYMKEISMYRNLDGADDRLNCTFRDGYSESVEIPPVFYLLPIAARYVQTANSTPSISLKDSKI